MSTDQTIEGTATDISGKTPGKTPGETFDKASGTPASARRRRRGLVAGAVAVPLALAAGGLALGKTAFPTTPLAPTAIGTLAPSGAVAVKGEVAEIFGNKFVVQDGTGRALVETGREGEGGTLVRKGETITVQGRFEKGFLHATLLTQGDGTVVRLGPGGGPPMGSLDWVKDKAGLGPTVDVGALTKSVADAGYTDVRVAGRGPRHLEVAARGQDGRERLLHVGFDGQIRERKVF